MTEAGEERRRRLAADPAPSTLLVLRLSALGDVIHTLPAVVALQHALPDTAFSWAVEQPYRELVELVASVPAVGVRLKKWGRNPLAMRREIGGAWSALRGFEAAVDFQGLTKSAVLGWLSGSRVRFGFDHTAVREKPALWFTNRKIGVDAGRHVIEQNLELAAGVAAAYGATLALDVRPQWERFPSGSDGVRDLAGAVVLLPGAGKPNKIWPAERFARLAAAIGPSALAVWGPGERGLAEATGARMAPPTSLRELAWILGNARAVVGADTGPLHLAAALGTPVIGLYGPTDPRRNGPYGQLHQCVSHFDSTKLMASISVDEVMTLLNRVVTQ